MPGTKAPDQRSRKIKKLAHLVKGIKTGKAKVLDTQLGEWKKGDKDTTPVEAPILMISRKVNIEHMVKLSEKTRILEHKRRVQESLLILTTYTVYHSRSIRPNLLQEIDDPDITMEEYIWIESEKALRKGKVYNWETATYGKIGYDEDVNFLRSVEMEFPAIVYNDALTSELELLCEPTISPIKLIKM
ncbi:hypothetical protein Tco_0959713 [Tanacetum coccineum]